MNLFNLTQLNPTATASNNEAIKLCILELFEREQAI